MIVCSVLGLKPDITQPIPMQMWITSAFLAVILSIAGAYWYFQGKNSQPNLETGFRFGLALIVVGFILDFLFFLSLSFEGHDPIAVMMNYYREPAFWLTLVLILLGSSFVGMCLERKKNMIDIEYLRQFRIGSFAIFDFTIAFLAMIALSPGLSWLCKKAGVHVPKRNWVILTLPISVLAHVLFGRITPLTKSFLDPSGHYLVKIIVIGCCIAGVLGVQRLAPTSTSR